MLSGSEEETAKLSEEARRKTEFAHPCAVRGHGRPVKENRQNVAIGSISLEA